MSILEIAAKQNSSHRVLFCTECC